MSVCRDSTVGGSILSLQFSNSRIRLLVCWCDDAGNMSGIRIPHLSGVSMTDCAIITVDSDWHMSDSWRMWKRVRWSLCSASGLDSGNLS
jgi:hypothetical protein